MLRVNNKEKWEKFRETGLFLFVNAFLQIFGWSIIIKSDKETGEFNVYPERVDYRGFPEESNTKAYIKLSKFMKENADELLKEAES